MADITINAGQTDVARVLGFDAIGTPVPVPSPSWVRDNATVINQTPATDGQSTLITPVGLGQCNLAVSAAGFNDVKSVAVVAGPLARIQIVFDPPVG